MNYISATYGIDEKLARPHCSSCLRLSQIITLTYPVKTTYEDIYSCIHCDVWLLSCDCPRHIEALPADPPSQVARITKRHR